MGGNSYSLSAVPLKCTTTAETLVMHCTINLSLSLVLVRALRYDARGYPGGVAGPGLHERQWWHPCTITIRYP